MGNHLAIYFLDFLIYTLEEREGHYDAESDVGNTTLNLMSRRIDAEMYGQDGRYGRCDYGKASERVLRALLYLFDIHAGEGRKSRRLGCCGAIVWKGGRMGGVACFVEDRNVKT